jgi:hypothetical protein
MVLYRDESCRRVFIAFFVRRFTPMQVLQVPAGVSFSPVTRVALYQSNVKSRALCFAPANVQLSGLSTAVHPLSARGARYLSCSRLLAGVLDEYRFRQLSQGENTNSTVAGR